MLDRFNFVLLGGKMEKPKCGILISLFIEDNKGQKPRTMVVISWPWENVLE